MNFDRRWTSFAVEAEVSEFGVPRIVAAHNRLRMVMEELVEIERRDNLTDPDMVVSEEWRASRWEAARQCVCLVP